MSEVRKLTVSEFIRESKPDWEQVRSIDKRSSTQSFSGCLQVHTGAKGVHDKNGRLVGATIDMEFAESFQDQVDRFDRQNLARDTSVFFGEKVVHVNDLGQETRVVGKIKKVTR